MTIIGEGIVAIRPETSGFASGLEAQLKGALGGVPAPIAAVAAGVVALGVTVFAVGEKFQGAFNKIKVGTGETGPVLDSLDASFKRVLAGTAGSFDQVAAAISGLHDRTGLVGPALDDLAKKEVTLGRITKTDVGANVEATTGLFNQYGIAATQQSAKLDVLFKASQVAGVSISDLTSQVSAATPVAKALGLTFDQTAALTANLTQAGLPASKVMQGLGKEFTAAAKAGKDPLSVISDIEEQIKKAPNDTAAAEIAFQKFGVRAGPQLADALRTGRFDLTQTLATITNGQGGINATGTAVSTLGGKFARLKNEILVALEPAGTALVRFANEGLGKIVTYLPVVIATVERWATIFKAAFDPRVEIDDLTGFERIVGVVGKTVAQVVSDIRAVFESVSSFIRANFVPSAAAVGAVVATVVVPAFIAWATATAAAAAATIVAAAPVIALTVAIGAVAFAVVYAYEHFAIFRDVVNETAAIIVNVVTVAFGLVVSVIRTALDLVTNVIHLALDLIHGDWGAAWEDVKAIISDALHLVLDLVTGQLQIMVAFFGDLPGRLLGALASLAGDLAGAAADALASMASATANGIIDVIGFYLSIPGRILDALGDLSGLLYNAGLAIMRGFLDGLKAGWSAVTGFVGSIGGWIADHKGPLDRDKALLVPAGTAIMGGLNAGLQAQVPSLENTLRGITNRIGSIGGGILAPTAGAATTSVTASTSGGVTLNATIVGSEPSEVVAQTMRALNWAAG